MLIMRYANRTKNVAVKPWMLLDLAKDTKDVLPKTYSWPSQTIQKTKTKPYFVDECQMSYFNIHSLFFSNFYTNRSPSPFYFVGLLFFGFFASLFLFN